MIVETGGFNENSSWFIGYLPDGTKKFYCLESDWREEYNEVLEKMEAEKKQEEERRQQETSKEDES